jgi:c-di-GMP-binding flagellar brake protein YcgR
VQIPVVVRTAGIGGNIKVNTVDLSEGGMAVVMPGGRRPTNPLQISFTLPGADHPLEIPAEFAWEASSQQAGLRFVNTSPDVLHELRVWLQKNSPEAEQDDPPIRCQLTDLSLGGCYLEIPSPFPVATRVMLSMRAAGVEVRVQGLVRVMHPDKGMGVEFTQATTEHRAAVEKFLGVLNDNRALSPELLVQPEGLERAPLPTQASTSDHEDPLLQLFYAEPIGQEEFQEALRKQRAIPRLANGAAAGAQA